VIPHAPQLAASVDKSVQIPEQMVRPAPQTHDPSRQIWPGAQARLQPPQLLTSDAMSMQLEPHRVRPDAQFPQH
jgi:hypothetical protein